MNQFFFSPTKTFGNHNFKIQIIRLSIMQEMENKERESLAEMRTRIQEIPPSTSNQNIKGTGN